MVVFHFIIKIIVLIYLMVNKYICIVDYFIKTIIVYLQLNNNTVIGYNFLFVDIVKLQYNAPAIYNNSLVITILFLDLDPRDSFHSFLL